MENMRFEQGNNAEKNEETTWAEYQVKVRGFVKEGGMTAYRKISDFLTLLQQEHPDLKQYKMFYAAAGATIEPHADKFDLPGNQIQAGLDEILPERLNNRNERSVKIIRNAWERTPPATNHLIIAPLPFFLPPLP